MSDTITLDTFAQAYAECAIWSSVNWDDGKPLDNDFGVEDISSDALSEMVSDCTDFQTDNESDLSEWDDDSQAGHDFWLTRNGHGAGFWDRGRGALGDRLTVAAKVYGGSDIYVGDDGELYV